MLGLISAFITSFIFTLLIVRYQRLHSHLSSDDDFKSPQKVHLSAVPRVGGIGIALGLFTACMLKIFLKGQTNSELMLLLCSIPAFGIGLTEDITKHISVRMRLLFAAFSAATVIYLLNISITSLDIPFTKMLFTIPFFGIALSIFAITGMANAYNIIDGFNGLASMVGMISLLAIGYVAYILNDYTISYLSLAMIGAILGFFVWNYPQGLIFLGDGGAYLIGFWIGTLSIWLCFKHPEVSPWFALLINGYPAMETVFTIYRRKIHQGRSPGSPDATHFHTLIYRRTLSTKHQKNLISANSKTSPYLWILTGLAVAPAVLWWGSTPILFSACILFVCTYIWLYKRIVRFQIPKWLNLY